MRVQVDKSIDSSLSAHLVRIRREDENAKICLFTDSGDTITLTSQPKELRQLVRALLENLKKLPVKPAVKSAG